MSKVQTRFNRFKNKPEKNSGKSKTERGSYIPPNVQIERMFAAGRRLEALRSGLYDHPEGLKKGEDAEIDPTRHPSVDMADISELQRGLAKKLADQALLQKEISEMQKKAEAAKALDKTKAEAAPHNSNEAVSGVNGESSV